MNELHGQVISSAQCCRHPTHNEPYLMIKVYLPFSLTIDWAIGLVRSDEVRADRSVYGAKASLNGSLIVSGTIFSEKIFNTKTGTFAPTFTFRKIFSDNLPAKTSVTLRSSSDIVHHSSLPSHCNGYFNLVEP